MGKFKKERSQALVLLALIFAFAISLFASVFSSAPVKAQADGSEFDGSTYHDTNVETILYKQASEVVFFAFKLTNHDYTERFGSDFGGAPAYDAYITSLSYWNCFTLMNSEGVSLPQIFVYWCGGSGANDLGVGFDGTMAHRSTLTLLEYGFVISIPKGTEFPSYEYVKGGCQGGLVAYRTTEDRAFYFDGSGFVPLAMEVAIARSNALLDVNAIDYSIYYDAEKVQVEKLVKNAQAQIKVAFSILSVQDALTEFYTALDEVMTKADYEDLADRKAQANIDVTNYYNGLNQDDYDEIEWNEITAIYNESQGVINSLGTIKEVESALNGVKVAIGDLLTKAEKPDFEIYRAEKAEKLESSFNESLYLQAEITLGNEIVEEGATLIASANTYSKVDAIFAEYISRLDELKTKTEYEEENRDKDSESTSESESESVSEGQNPDNLSWIFIAIGGGVAILAVLAVVIIIIIKKRKEVQNEE